jgi:hypothetical protein
MAANPVKKAPWKIPFDVNGSGPYVIKVLLSDLLFDKQRNGAPNDPNTWVPWESGGFRLPYDILLYDPSIYGTDGGLLPSAPQRERQSRGFFLTKVMYDSRSTSRFIHNPFYRNQVPGNSATAGYTEYDPNAALTPTDDFDYRRRDLTFNVYLPPPGSEYFLNNDYYTSSCTVATEGSQQEKQTFLVLTNRDDALEATIPGSSVIPFTRLRANADTSIQEVYDVVRFFTEYGVGDSGDRSIKTIPGQPPITAADTLNPIKNVRLQTVELWLRCSYFADYVDPESYAQDLHKLAEVQHKNLIVGVGDFDKFTREPSSNEIRPYLPLTPPREDRLSATLRIANAIGSFPIPPKAGEYNNPIDQANTPVGWLDPDFQTLNDTNAHIVSQSGNIYTSGRIFSPTIDELWVYIKKVISGRPADASAPTTAAAPLSNSVQQTITADMRIGAEPTYLLGNKLGDPLNATGSEFVNSGEGIRYVMNAGIQRSADALWPGIVGPVYRPFVSLTGDERAAFGALQTGERWGLRANPMSLRELEAAIKNEAFNAEVIFNYIMTNTVVGGHTASSADGTLYRLHRDHDPTNTSARWVSGKTELPSEDVYGESLPGSDILYDHLSHIHKGDVYLSAEGRWRYLFDHVRVPVLDEQY